MKSFINSFFDRTESLDKLESYSEKALAKKYRLMDGDILHSIITNRKENITHKAKGFFENYSGESAHAWYFSKFLPEEIKSNVIQNIATKRLNWFIKQVCDKNKVQPSFTESDIELFQSSRLNELGSTFSFSKVIRNHKLFSTRWYSKMEKFLRSCKEFGFDDGQLLTEYKIKNHRIKRLLSFKIEDDNTSPNILSSQSEMSQSSIVGSIKNGL